MNPSGERVAFTLAVSRTPAGLVGEIVNGNDRLASSSASMVGDTLRLGFDFYDGELVATLDGNSLSGAFTRQWQRQKLTRVFQASRVMTTPRSDGAEAPINGSWIIEVGAPTNRRYWRAEFHAVGEAAGGTIIPVSGDWGDLSGTWIDRTLTLYRFDGINSRVFRATLQPDGTLVGEYDLGLPDDKGAPIPKPTITARRFTPTDAALVANLPDPNAYTRMKNASEPFRFSFPDLAGVTVSSTDDRFKGKVRVVSITGSWCPNCHEETPFMQSLYAKYHAQGLEVVALAFEYTGERARDIEQVRIFARKYGVAYPILYAGATDELEAKVPQLERLGAFPTTIFIGRDGLVKFVHAGFEGKATKDRFAQLKADTEQRIVDLLAAPAR